MQSSSKNTSISSGKRGASTIWRLARIGLASFLALAAPSAGAAEPDGGDGKSGVRYERKSKRTKAKSDLLDTKFKSAVKTSKKGKDRPPEMMSARDFRKEREAVEQSMADQQIAMLKDLITNAPGGDPELPDYLFRLADHYNEKQHYYSLQAGALYEGIYDAEEKKHKSKVRQLKQKQKRFQKDAKKMHGESAKVYKALTNQPAFANYKRMDEALYLYAYVLGELERDNEMKEVFKKLINNYPDSKFISHAYLAFADYYYDQQQIQPAVRLYEKVLQFKDSPVYAYALYKLAWCHLNPIGTAEPRYDLSLNYFVATIKATQEGRAGSEAAGKQLRRDARRDLVKAYMYASKPSKAWEFFGKWGVGPGKEEDDARKMMTLLADAYFANGMYTESTFTYKRLQEEFDGDADTCMWQGRIVINTLATDNKEVQWNETRRLGEYWLEYKDAKHKKAVKRKCRDDALATMKQMATVWHDEAHKTNLPLTYQLAEKAYSYFLEVFPKDKDAYELQYYYGELLWSLASNHYNSKAESDRNEGLKYFRKSHAEFVKALELNPKGKFTRDAAQAQMLAMKNALEYDETGGKAKACKTNSEGVCTYKTGKKKKEKRDKDTKVDAAAQYPESDYTDDEKQMLAAYDRYMKYVNDPKDKELPKIMFHRANLMMVHNKFDEARPLLEKVLAKFDGTIYGAWCSEMLLDLLTIKWVDSGNTPEQTVKASDDLEEWANKFQKMKVWTHPEADQIREAVPRLLAGIGWKKGKAYQEAGKAYFEGDPNGDPDGFRKCMNQFVEVWNEYENHDQADTLLWNAAECADAAYVIGDAINIRQQLLSNHPESKHAKRTLEYLAKSYRSAAMFQESATHYEQYADKYEKDPFSEEALQNAYLFRLGLGDSEKAAENLNKYEALFKRKNVAKAATIFWSRHALLDNDEEKKEHAIAYLKTYGGKGGKDRQVVAEAAVGQALWRQSCPKELLYDSCISIARKRALSAAQQIEQRKKLERKLKKKGRKKFVVPDRCGEPTKGVVTVYKRDKKLAAEAQKRFSNVLRLVGKGKIAIPEDEPNRAEAFKNAWGMAMVYRADQKFEAFLEMSMPTDLFFGVEQYKKDSGIPRWEREYAEQVKKEAESKKKLEAYMAQKVKLMAELAEQYAAVKGTGSKAWWLAAAGRTAATHQNFADELYRAPVPSGVIKTEEMYDVYCDQLAQYGDPQISRAVEAYTACIEASTKNKYFNEFSRMCEDEMQQTDADRYPATNEAFGQSTYTTSRIAHVGVYSDPTGGSALAKQTRRKKGKSGDSEDSAADDDAGEEE
ncbi:MAG: tetratricopeptide repeat protein [Myxococcales bacterium FL481]|nr:MAG: tetratricopeptide repeat protein [Myxococcales bacterium FL481]